MKVMHVSNFPVSKNGGFIFAIPFKLSNGFSRLGHFVYNFADRELADSYFLGARKLGAPLANRQLIRMCKDIRPDLLLLGHCCVITPETVAAIREALPAVRIAHWNCDGLFLPKNHKRMAALAPLVDATFMTTAGDYQREIAQHGGRVAYMPNPVDRSIESQRTFERNDVENDLVFMSGDKPYNSPRIDLCSRVRTELPDLKFDVRGFWGKPGVYGAEYFDVLGNSRMALNISARDDVYLYSSDRMSQLMGCGLLTFVNRSTGFADLFGEDELVTYRDADDLVAKIRYYKTHDDKRRETARRGWGRVHAHFNETLVAQWITDVTFGQSPTHHYAWPMDVLDSSSTVLRQSAE